MPNSQFTHHFNWMSLKANAMHALSRLMLPKFLLKVKHINCTKYWGSLGLFHKCVRYNLIIFTHQFPSLPSHGSLSSLFHLSLFFKNQLHCMSEKSVQSSSLAYFTEHNDFQAHPLSYKQYDLTICCDWVILPWVHLLHFLCLFICWLAPGLTL